MINNLKKAKEALEQLTVKGEQNAVLYVIAHQNISDAIALAAAKEASGEGDQNGNGN